VAAPPVQGLRLPLRVQGFELGGFHVHESTIVPCRVQAVVIAICKEGSEKFALARKGVPTLYGLEISWSQG
jgi:hypothetical protein